MAYTHQAQIPLQNLSSQAKHAEIFPNLHSSIISIRQLYNNECIVTFDKHEIIVSKNKYTIIEVYREPMNGFWSFPLHHPAQNNKQSKMLEQNTCKTGANTLNQWHRGTPEHINQHAINT